MDPQEFDVVFHPFDPSVEIQISERNLPHWFQPGVAIFVTFRTRDSLPRDVVARWARELTEWLRIHNLPPGLASHITGIRPPEYESWLAAMTPQQRADFRKLSDRWFHVALDEYHGERRLRHAEYAGIVASAIQHGDGHSYNLDSFVVMPNHVHAIVQFRSGSTLSIVSQSWMRYSAREINRIAGTSGAFWQAEPFDHLIRSPEQFVYLKRYIADNPQKAGLTPSEFLYWART